MFERKSKAEQVKPRRKSPRDEIRDGSSLLLSEIDPLKRKAFERVVSNYADACGLVLQLCTNSFSEMWTLSYYNSLLLFRNVDTEEELLIILQFFPYSEQRVITTSLSVQVCDKLLQFAKPDRLNRSMILIDGTKSKPMSTPLPVSSTVQTASEEKKSASHNGHKFVNRNNLILSGPVDTGKSQRVGGLQKLAEDAGLRVIEIFDIADDRHEKLARFTNLTESRYDLVICRELYDLETFDVLVRQLSIQGVQFILATTLSQSKIQPILSELQEFRKSTVKMNGNVIDEVVYCVRGCLPIGYYELDNRDWVSEWAAKPSKPMLDEQKIYGIDKYPPSLLLLGPGGVAGKFLRETALNQVAWERRINCLFMRIQPNETNGIVNKLPRLSHELNSSTEYFTGVGNVDLLCVEDLKSFLHFFGGQGKHLLMGTSLTAEAISSSPKLMEQLKRNNVTMINAAIPIDCFPGALAWASKL